MRKHTRPVTDAELLRRVRRRAQTPRARQLGRFSRRVSLWLQRAGLPAGRVRAEISNDLVELLEAADHVREHLEAMLGQNPATKRGARICAKHATGIQVIASSELLYHVRRLCRRWEKQVEDALYRRADGVRRRTAA